MTSANESPGESAECGLRQRAHRAPAAPARPKVARWGRARYQPVATQSGSDPEQRPAGAVRTRASRGGWNEEDEGPGLLASPAFWIAGLLCFAGWVVLILLFGLV